MKIAQNITISGGKLVLPHRSQLISDIAKFKDGDYVLTIEKKSKKRSLDQNAYYWGVVVPIVKQGLNDVGYRMTTETTHDYLKTNFNIIEIANEINGEIISFIGSTTEMTTSQMMDYFAKITQWSAEYLGVQIPEPNEQLKITF